MKKHFILFFACIIFNANLHAYVDPGSGGALITAILGFIAAFTYSVKKYFYKLKSFFKRK